MSESSDSQNTQSRPVVHKLIAALFQDESRAVLIKDQSSRILYANSAASSLVGLELDDLVGKTDFDLLPSIEAAKIKILDDTVFSTGADRLFEEQITSKDGTTKTLMTHKRRVTLPAEFGEANILVAVISDITELRNAEAILKTSEAHYRSLIELHPQVLWVADADGQVIEVGPGWSRVSGLAPDAALGSGWAELIYPPDLANVQQGWKHALETGSPFDAECRFVTPDGNHRWFRNRAAAQHDDTGRIVLWYGMFEDVHDRQLALEGLRASEQTLRQHRDQLETTVQLRTAEVEAKSKELNRLLEQEREVNALQRRFVTMISHEFRTPLTIIDAAAQRLLRSKKDLTPEYLAEKTGQIKNAANRMVELMESILAAGRLRSGTIAIKKERCSIRQLIIECLNKRSDINASHRFDHDLDGLPAFIDADQEAVERVFVNLFSNAVKYSPGKPNIHIKGWSDKGLAMITVSDEGVGMDSEDLPKLFQPYFRARSAAGIAGTGIGLNIAKEIVELHGGAITVESTLGRGTIFTVSLPANYQEKSLIS